MGEGGRLDFFLRCCCEPPGLMAIEGEGPERGKSLKKSAKKRHHLYCRGVGEYWGTFRVRHAFYCLGTRKQRSFDLIALKFGCSGA